MKKLILFVLTALILTACVNTEDAFEAKVSDFEDSGFTNTKGQIIAIVEDAGILVSGTLHSPEKKSSLDKVLEKENAGNDKHFSKVYSEGKIETTGTKYYVTLDETTTLEFEKVAQRKIKDSEGVEYVTQEYPK
ncbi:hypothetical protein [Ureibacillus acetophenoni]|uniref:Lipoprotein n=1 Tax=Ureibacillus acetophenoni TaxID=614649 RepID=A0A285UPT8_9BACL|nr:hypothetical protein [Ureibacillus acetophenoni]SOC43829.1 hypothetical protein SAMN05877842_11761 [Ureibacillus acetophenoni]